MSSTTLLTLSRELRDMVLQYVMHSPQPELEFHQLALLSETFVVSSAQTIAPTNMLSTCQQLRVETWYLMNLRDRIPRLEIHIRDMSTGWEVCTAWKVPPSACVQSRLRRHDVNSMTVDIKPRNTTAYSKSTFPDRLQHHSASRTLLRDSIFSADVKGDCLGILSPARYKS